MNRTLSRFLLISAIACMTGHPAWADPLAHCGTEPATPSISTVDAAHYNSSVDSFQAYEKEARAYNTCVSTAASREESSISEDARTRIAKVHAQSVAVQQRIAGNFQKIGATLSAGAKKLAHH